MTPKKRKIKTTTLGLLLLLSILSTPCALASTENSPLEPVLTNGRVKPFDSFARQTLKLVSGREKWQGQDPSEFFVALLKDRSKISSLPWIRVDYGELKKSLHLNDNEHFFSLDQLSVALAQIDALTQSAREKRDQDLRPFKLEQKAEQLRMKIYTVENLVSGQSPETPPADALLSQARLQLEVFYNRLKPFEWAAFLYFFAFLLHVFFPKNSRLGQLTFIAVLLAILFHTFGLAARIYILSRPPVSNMYESMIFMNWALMIFALTFSAIRKSPEAAVAGCALSGFVMIYANILPIDSGLDVVVAVLRSNYWLTIHVLTIVSSYGAFGLAMSLGHRHLFLEATHKLPLKKETDSASLIFRVIQLGVILVGTGTFLGGVWANESWGRFWGWDPKETWALITFLGYLVIVHLRYAKRISNFYLAVSSVLGFLLVLMTWYGVNFILGRGLHSYGSGSGGMEWVVYYLVLEAIFLVWAFLRRSAKQ